ncbi:hypothetical protein PG999_007832 [Apiospora kogelbergensis]|uniref:Uncharacterized protein n=1 Tax=Apiospora kogelbergensis TaxID=1337665 RepID=A0AAW0QMQ3_9PEZI
MVRRRRPQNRAHHHLLLAAPVQRLHRRLERAVLDHLHPLPALAHHRRQPLEALLEALVLPLVLVPPLPKALVPGAPARQHLELHQLEEEQAEQEGQAPLGHPRRATWAHPLLLGTRTPNAHGLLGS